MRVIIRISKKDLAALQKLAPEEGIACRPLMASALHKCVSVRL